MQKVPLLGINSLTLQVKFLPGVNVYYFSVFALKIQYLCKFSMFIYICVYICSPLSGLCTSRFKSDFRSQREGISLCTCKILNICIFVIFVIYLNHLLTGKMLNCGILCSYFHLVNSFGYICHNWCWSG